MIRTTPWEVSRDVKLHPRDEGDWHTLAGTRALREAFARNNPGGRLTWGFTLNALEDKRENYKQIRANVAQNDGVVENDDEIQHAYVEHPPSKQIQ